LQLGVELRFGVRLRRVERLQLLQQQRFQLRWRVRLWQQFLSGGGVPVVSLLVRFGLTSL
jgi:hypothetical protein